MGPCARDRGVGNSLGWGAARGWGVLGYRRPMSPAKELVLSPVGCGKPLVVQAGER